MTYKELLEKYKNGDLDEQQRKVVETEIEKHSSISEYLFEQDSLDDVFQNLGDHEGADVNASDFSGVDTRENNQAEIHAAKEEQEFTDYVRKAMRKAFIKVGAATAAVVLVAVILIQTIVPKLVSSFYYDPGKKLGERTNQMSFDLEVYNELFMPAEYHTNVSAADKGFGNYDITISQNVSYTGRFTDYVGRVDQGKFTVYNGRAFQSTSNYFGWFQMEKKPGMKLSEIFSDVDNEDYEGIMHANVGLRTQATESLKELNDQQPYICYVTLDEILSYDDYRNLLEKNNISADWCAVVISEESFNSSVIGFRNDPYKSREAVYDQEKYPELSLWTDDNEYKENGAKDSERMKQHFLSSMKYIDDQKDFLKLMSSLHSYENTDPIDLSEEIQYIENHDLMIYGFTMICDKEEALRVNDIKGIYEISAVPVE